MTLSVEILSTGDEILKGLLVDTNSTWLMDRLWELGVMARRQNGGLGRLNELRLLIC